MILTLEERHSALWTKLKEHMQQQIDLLRLKNDGALDEVTTASIRGEIRALKRLSAVDQPPIEVTDE